MLFLDCLLEASAASGPQLRWSMEAGQPCGRLTLRQTTVSAETPAIERITEVSARDLDASKVYITGVLPDGLRYIRAVCGLYREAVRTTEKRGPAEEESRSVIFRFPVNPAGSDGTSIIASFQEYLAECGATPPSVNPEEEEELLEPLREVLRNAGFTGPDQSDVARLDAERLLLIREQKMARAPLERWTFELLSLDRNAVACHKSVGSGDAWQVTLSSVEHLPTTLWQYARGGSSTAWSFVLNFPGEAEARRFAGIAANVVGQLRERLYRHWQAQGSRPEGQG